MPIIRLTDRQAELIAALLVRETDDLEEEGQEEEEQEEEAAEEPAEALPLLVRHVRVGDGERDLVARASIFEVEQELDRAPLGYR